MTKRFLPIAALLLAAWLLAVGCAPAVMGISAVATPTPTGAPRLTPSPSPIPTATPAPTATPVPTPYTIVWMSDTQEYASTYPDIYYAMMQYVADNMEAQNFVYLLHTGDIINNPFTDHDAARARDVFALLPDALPVLTVCGNHDISRNRNEWGYMDFDYSPYLGYDFDTDRDPAHWMENGVNHYALFSAGGVDFLFLSIGYGMEEEGVDWANEVIAAYPNHIVVLCTHSYLQPSWKLSGPGEILYEGIAKPNENVRLVLCGHLRGAQRYARDTDTDGDGETDRTVNEILFNYQYETMGGYGYLRLLTVEPVSGDVHVETYSPFLDDYSFRDAKDTFDLPGLFRRPDASS